VPIRERIESVDRISQWTDSIPLHYEYTAGVAGERFLRGLMEAKILAGYCPRCKETFLPPRIYCVECYGPVHRYVKVGPYGKVATLTTANPTGEAPSASPTSPSRVFAGACCTG
jgi:uncharacterized OB-fold protein